MVNDIGNIVTNAVISSESLLHSFRDCRIEDNVKMLKVLHTYITSTARLG